MSFFNKLLWGLIAGIIGGTAGALILWGAWLLPALGLLLTRVSIINGGLAMLILGALGGVVFSLISGRLKLNMPLTLVSGLVLGVVFWVVGVLIAVPLILGFPPLIRSPQDHLVSLGAFIIYGLIVSLLYSTWAGGRSPVRVYYAGGLLALAMVAAPLMLWTATSTEPEMLELPKGYRAEVVAKGFTYPTGIALDEKGRVYVAEAGYSYGPKTTAARVFEVGSTGITEVTNGFEGPLNGIIIQNDKLYASHRGIITELDLKTKARRNLVTDLPSLGDHQNNDLLFGKDGALYFGQGTATNAGVVGHDNFVYAWADRFPKFHDIPSRDLVLTGENYRPLDLGSVNPVDTKPTGGFSPFGTPRKENENVQGKVPASGVIHRLDLNSGELSVFCDGLRNPYGLTIGPDGSMYATNLGYDDRGVRAVKDSPDWVVKLKKGAWYGWPDYAGSKPLTDSKFASERGINLNPLIADPPPVEPPLAELSSHYSPMKLAYSPEDFPAQGLFVAVFGDGQPLTQDLSEQVATGVILVDPADGSYSWFVKNKQKPRAGRMGDGLKRVIDVKFANDGKSLYILDFGVMEFTDLAPNSIPNTGVLWKVKAMK